MKYTHPFLTIAIPVRNRGKYLPSVFETILTQEYSDVEVLVLDNQSDDGTEALVSQKDDPRLRYLPSDAPLGMAENWERGLDHARGEYVFYLGGDDGLLPGALNDVDKILRSLAPPSLTWQKPDYTWPDASPPNLLQLELPGPLMWMNGRMVLSLLARGWTNYGLLPNVYSSFVKRDFINATRGVRGKFFSSVTPDVYSAVTLISEFSDYLFSPYPFSISGGSGASNGMSNAIVGGLDAFFAESQQEMHKSMPVIPGSISSCVLEALYTANDLVFDGHLRINRSRYLSLIIEDLNERLPEIRVAGLEALGQLELTRGERRLIEKAMRERGSIVCGETALIEEAREIARSNVVSVLDCQDLGVHDIEGAAKLARALVGRFEMPAKIRRFSWNSAGMEVLTRGWAKVALGGSSGRRPPPSILNL